MRSSAPALVLLAAVITGCSEPPANQQSPASTEIPVETRIDQLFETLIDGVQLIESAQDVAKQSGPLDESTAPPSYTVSYAGCLDGFVGGAFCVADGLHRVDVVAPSLHIIRSVDQRYELKAFASTPDFALTGDIDSHVQVAVDVESETTAVEGTAKGQLEVTGELDGPVGVDLSIGGGRNYTEATATPIVVEGTFTYDGETYAVSGGFQRE